MHLIILHYISSLFLTVVVTNTSRISTMSLNKNLKISWRLMVIKITFMGEHQEIMKSVFHRAWKFADEKAETFPRSYHNKIKVYWCKIEWNAFGRRWKFGVDIVVECTWVLGPRDSGTLTEFCGAEIINRIFNQLRTSIQLLHSANIVHCDLKPSIIFRR